MRAQHLEQQPLCVFCKQRDRTAAATEVDHIRQHHGDPVLFFDRNNLQSLCAYCHRVVKARMERGGTQGFNEDGEPIDDGHRWRTG